MLFPDEVVAHIFDYDPVSARVYSRRHSRLVQHMNLDPSKLRRPMRMCDAESFVRLDDCKSKWMTLLCMAMDDGMHDVANYLFTKLSDPKWVAYSAVERDHPGAMTLVVDAVVEEHGEILSQTMVEELLYEASKSTESLMYELLHESFVDFDTMSFDFRTMSTETSLEVAKFIVKNVEFEMELQHVVREDDIVLELYDSFVFNASREDFAEDDLTEWLILLRKGVQLCDDGISFHFEDSSSRYAYTCFMDEAMLNVLIKFEEAVANVPHEYGNAFSASDTLKLLDVLLRVSCMRDAELEIPRFVFLANELHYLFDI